MNNYCIGLLIISLVFICFQNKSIKEGLEDKKIKIPKRVIPIELRDVLSSDAYGDLNYEDKDDPVPTSSMRTLFHKASNEDAMFAKSNFKECHHGSGLHSCSIATPKHKTIDIRYLNLPPQELDSSNVYHNLSICPQTYQKNMDILRSKQSIGQYSGYSDHSYIDRTRYFKTNEGEPLPVNADFFAKGGGYNQ